ncbi:protein-methionine-sulfoxide reductase heme-binding subunit MsrQ [Terrihabitans rhizophilus]|uniref:Protein-methionine-sulfoxide reductase heme-binding subunit MsrQ n=1 Tax=Terrihabitans rhizophilus TaxID=3092662 RepID=A0ABU4RWW2_9HYPH|nr:protein-methionine-sulfoxide reductase heme-binding subunit MsrQ [Terrihabitans sp. PJ23]MDX6807391.1 protein-methionine-sulfoxide reductase heme-binding subunit MsrQ [Terrihabitans sp. PJ23]
MPISTRNWPGPWLAYLVMFIPVAALVWTGFNDELGPDPARALEHELGIWALRFLILALLITPVRRLTGLNLLRYRRAIGLTAFWYALLHLLAWLVLDRQLDAGAILSDIWKRPYITIGMIAFALLIPLAATSNRYSIRRLGGAIWARVHKLAYAATALAAVHFVMVVKSWPPEPLIYAGIVVVLLGYRAVMAFHHSRASSRDVRTRAT